MREFNDRTAVITGAASGIGLALAHRAAREGMRLVLADIDEAMLAEVKKTLPVPGEALCTRRVDVSREEDIAALADEMVEGGEHVGRCDEPIVRRHEGALLLVERMSGGLTPLDCAAVVSVSSPSAGAR